MRFAMVVHSELILCGTGNCKVCLEMFILSVIFANIHPIGLGAADADHWETLSKHTNDTSLNGPYASHAFSISGHGINSYRFLRIVQTGHNSSNNNFLVLSGFEFYGSLQIDDFISQ